MRARWWRLANPVRVSSISTVPGGDDRPAKDERTASYAGQFGPNYAEKHRRMGPGGCLCCSDNAPQDGDSVGAVHSRGHPAPNAGLCYPPHFWIQQPSNGSRRRSRPIYFGDIWQPIHHVGLRYWDPKRRESVVAPSAHLSSRGEIGAERLPASKRSPLSRCRPVMAIPGKGVQCQCCQFGMRASPYTPPNIESTSLTSAPVCMPLPWLFFVIPIQNLHFTLAHCLFTASFWNNILNSLIYIWRKSNVISAPIKD